MSPQRMREIVKDIINITGFNVVLVDLKAKISGLSPQA
jgi:hypothetical protein